VGRLLLAIWVGMGDDFLVVPIARF